MPKASKKSNLSRIARRVAAANHIAVSISNKDDSGEEDAPGKQNLSRGQKRRLAKREQYLKREKMILSSLQLKEQEEQKTRIDGLDAIRDALMKTSKKGGKTTTEQNSSYNTNRAKKRLVANETQHMGLVLQHPAFQAHPFETIQEHLRNTLAQERGQLESKAQERSKNEKGKLEEQKQEKKLQGVKKRRKKFKAGRTKY